MPSRQWRCPVCAGDLSNRTAYNNRISLLSPLLTLFIAPLGCSLLDKEAYSFPQYSWNAMETSLIKIGT
jgi:hypothetical protein